MDINAFNNNLKVLSDAQSDESTINKALIFFERNVSANLFSVLRNNMIQNVFQDIFSILFNLSHYNLTSIKLESSRAMSIFLTRLLPFYTELLQKSFSNAIEENKKRTPLIPASFAFMSKHVSQTLLLQYLNTSLIVDHFQVDDPCYSTIIDNMNQVGTGFLQYLLKKLIEQLEFDPNRHLFLAIGSVIKHSPTLFLPQILNLDSLQLFAYVFKNVEFDYTKYDVSHVAELISNVLQSNESSPLERDCAYQVLSTLSPKVSVSKENESLIDVTFCDTKVTLDPQDNLNRPPFFLLPLPLNLLLPKENESVLILSSKYKTIAKSTTDENVNEVVSIFRKSLSLPYNEASSAAIIGFASQPKRLNSPELINMVIYKKPVSWFHSIDILRVIKSFQIVNVHTLNLLYEFIISDNIRLSRESIDTVKNLTNNENSEMIESFFSQKVDLFDYDKFHRVLTTLIYISGKSSNKSFLSFLNKILIEGIDLYKDHVSFLSLVFDYLSCKNLSNEGSLIPVCKIAVAVCEAYLSAIFGDTNEAENNNKEINFKRFLSHAKRDVLSRSFDIVNENKSYGQSYPSFLAAVRFIFSLPIYAIGASKAVDLSYKIFTFFPNICSSFYEKNWPNFDEMHQLKVLQFLFMKLQFVSESRTIAAWCRIALKTPHLLFKPEVSKTMQSMDFMCMTLLTPNLEDMKSAASFVAYLHVSNSGKHKKDIEVFILNLNNRQKTVFQDELQDIFENKIPQFFSDLFSTESGSQSESDDDDDDLNAENEVVIQINETGFNADMNRAILNGKSWEVVGLIQRGLKENVPFSLFDFCYPSLMKTEISRWANMHCSYLSLKKLLSNNSDIDSQKKLSLLELLDFARTEWKPLLVSFFNGHPSTSVRLLMEIQNAQKVRYNEILNISSIMPHVYLESSELFKLASRIAMHAEKQRKMRASFLFLAHALSIVNRTNAKGQFKPRQMHSYSTSIPDSPLVSDLSSLLKRPTNASRAKFEPFVIPNEFPNDFMNRINGFFGSLPHREVALALVQIAANKKDVDTVFLYFCRKLLLAGSMYTQEAGLLSSLVITRYEELIAANKNVSIDFESIVKSLLSFCGSQENKTGQNATAAASTSVESFFSNLFGLTKSKPKSSEDSNKKATATNNNDGANKSNDKKAEAAARAAIINGAFTTPSMLMSACRIINASQAPKDALYTVMCSFKFFHRIPRVNKMIIRSITCDTWQVYFKYMMRPFNIIDQSKPEFEAILNFAGFVLSLPELVDDGNEETFYTKSLAVVRQTVANPPSRKLMKAALTILLKHRELIGSNDNDKRQKVVIEVLVEWLNGLGKEDGFLTLSLAFEFARILESKLEQQEFFDLIANQYIKLAPRFFTVFPVVAKYYMKFKKTSWATNSVKSCLTFLTTDCHRKAMCYLVQGDLQVALKLCFFEKDCEESIKIIDENPLKEDLCVLTETQPQAQPPQKQQQQQQQAAKTRVTRPRSRTSRPGAPPE
ncbi:hypothetical protein M9Y10_030988 [Tritrichomonas musculus]|uniref:Uncharacterized protein n=1 Tax=Tritrichomonas musculus TaxID=1915356 RepID=A0ABR2H1H4_9EUKA